MSQVDPVSATFQFLDPRDPIAANLWTRFILKPKGGVAGAIHFSNTEPGQILLVSRHDPTAPVQIFKTPPVSSLHHANAFEDGKGGIVLDTLKYTVGHFPCPVPFAVE